MEVWIDACRDEDVSLAFELPGYRLDVPRLEAGEVEQHVGLCLCQSAGELSFVFTVESDIAGKRPVRPLLPARCDRLDAAPHQLLACRDADEPGPAEDKGAGQG